MDVFLRKIQTEKNVLKLFWEHHHSEHVGHELKSAEVENEEALIEIIESDFLESDSEYLKAMPSLEGPFWIPLFCISMKNQCYQASYFGYIPFRIGFTPYLFELDLSINLFSRWRSLYSGKLLILRMTHRIHYFHSHCHSFTFLIQHVA